MSSENPIRKHPVHGVRRVEFQPTIVFLTVCMKNRQPILANDVCHDCLLKAWQQAEAWRVGRYVVMPDHIHLFAGLVDRQIDLDRWVRYWKSLVTKLIERSEFKWQSGHWDTRMRNAEQYESKWEYVRNNPVRHGLVKDASDWPYAGVIAEVGWD